MFSCVLVFLSGLICAQDYVIFDEEVKGKWYKPDFFKLQFAGNIGLASIGLGYEWWNEKAQSVLLYGFVPDHKGEAEIHTFTIKNTFRLYKFNLYDKFNLCPTAGFSVSFEPGENSYMRVPDKYPDGYYSPNSFYACLNLGVKSKVDFKEERKFSGLGVFFEVNTLADYVYYNIKAQEDWDDDILSFALGMNVFF